MGRREGLELRHSRHGSNVRLPVMLSIAADCREGPHRRLAGAQRVFPNVAPAGQQPLVLTPPAADPPKCPRFSLAPPKHSAARQGRLQLPMAAHTKKPLGLQDHAGEFTNIRILDHLQLKVPTEFQHQRASRSRRLRPKHDFALSGPHLPLHPHIYPRSQRCICGCGPKD